MSFLNNKSILAIKENFNFFKSIVKICLVYPYIYYVKINI